MGEPQDILTLVGFSICKPSSYLATPISAEPWAGCGRSSRALRHRRFNGIQWKSHAHMLHGAGIFTMIDLHNLMILWFCKCWVHLCKSSSTMEHKHGMGNSYIFSQVIHGEVVIICPVRWWWWGRWPHESAHLWRPVPSMMGWAKSSANGPSLFRFFQVSGNSARYMWYHG